MREDILEGKGDLHVWAWYTDQDHATGQVTGVEGLFIGFRVTDCLNDDIGSEPTGQLLDGSYRIGIFRVDRFRGTKLLRLLEFPIFDIDGDDRGSSGQLCPGNSGHADTTATDDCHSFPSFDLASIDGSTDTCHDATTQQSYGSVRRLWDFIDFGALTGGNKGFLGKGPDTQGCFEFGPVLQSHFLGGVVGIETVLQITLTARAAFTADSSPVQNDLIADSNFGNAFPNFGDDSGGLVAEKIRIIIAYATGDITVIGMADAAGFDIDDDFTGPRMGDHDGFNGDRVILGFNNRCFDVVGHQGNTRSSIDESSVL